MLSLIVVIALIQPPCDRPAAGAATEQGWTAYRAGDSATAEARFVAADAACPGFSGARAGLGFVHLQAGRASDATEDFGAALTADSTNADAWYGLGLARSRSGQAAGAIAAWRGALRVTPGYTDALDALLAAGVDSGLPLPSRARSTVLSMPARISGERFEIRVDSTWRPFYVQGVNLGAALPGKFPSDFPPDDSTYTHWLGLMAAANANVVRVYTILPPAFYRAFKAWNTAHADHQLWLVHGVWAEPPPNDDYDNAAWKGEFRAEMRRVVDLVHGRAAIGARPGHARGLYDADVSDHVLGYIIGREWEPFTIQAYDKRRRNRTAYAGRFLAVDHGSPADAWMAEQCDYLMGYEWDTWNATRPIAYTNWATLDPLHHPTEPTQAEEQTLRAALGLNTSTRVKEYDNDGEALDAMLVRTTAANVAGYFASFHAYPYYPDFIGLDSAYGRARSTDGASHYLGYLQDLKRYHAGRALLISEYGVPSSRGIAHLDADGFDHGGHDEEAMAALDVRLTREIREAGLAGGIVFAWMDEWFKHNWVVIDLERPAERTRLWHNTMDAEQSYGLMGIYAGDSTRPEPGGPAGRWTQLPLYADSGGISLRLGADPSYLYLALQSPRAIDSTHWVIGIDTDRPDRGQFTLPGGAGSSPVGLEFALDLKDTADAQLLVTPTYNPYLVPRAGMGPAGLDAFYNPWATIDATSRDGIFDSLFVTTNRFRIARNGQTFPARGVNRGRLRFGSAETSSLSDWFVDPASGVVEIRIPWGLLNVTDPSSRTVLRRIGMPAAMETTTTDGFRFIVSGVSRTGTPVARLATPTYSWSTWEEPTWHERLKPVYFALQSLWGSWGGQ